MQTEHSSKLSFIVVEATQPCSVIPAVRGMDCLAQLLTPDSQVESGEVILI
jgi:hypothetical protein